MDDLHRKRLVLGFRRLLSKKRHQASPPLTPRKVIVQRPAPAGEPRQRKRIDLEVRLNVAEQTVSGQAVDLSTGGIGICGSSIPLPTGTELELLLPLPASGTQEPLKLRGIVCYRSDSRCGVRFVNLTPADEKRILEIIASH